MKHIILLATANQASLMPFLERSEKLLHASYQKYFKAFSLEEVNSLKPVSVVAGHEGNFDQLVSKVENEIKLEQYGKEHGYTIDLLRGLENETTLMSQTSVADLMIIELGNLKRDHSLESLKRLIEQSACPVLLLPKDFKIECMVVTLEGNQQTVRMVKSLLKLFAEGFRDLPLSLLMIDPEDELEIQKERVLVNYLKLHFKNMGAQHMYDEPITSLFKYVQNECENPLVIVDPELGNELLDFTELFETQLFNHPIFIYKD